MERQNFSLALFGKNLKDLKHDDLLLFFSEKQVETSFLEFKSGNSKIKDLTQEISAFLNTGGGILILGAPREEKDKTCSGSLTKVTCCNNEDQLSRTISGNISPLPISIEYQPIKHQDGCSYIIEIQPSSYAPHQDNHSGAYFIRINEEKKAAPHSLVESLFFKRQRPKFNLRNETLEWKGDNIVYKGGVINETPYPAERVSHLITVLGIKSCISPNFNQSSPLNFKQIRHSGYSLIREIQWPFNFEFEAFSKEPIIISHLIWNKDGKVFNHFTLIKDQTNTDLNPILFEEEEDATNELAKLRKANLRQLISQFIPNNDFNYNKLSVSLFSLMKEYSITLEENQFDKTYSYYVSGSDFLELLFIKESGKTTVTLRYVLDDDLKEVVLNP